MKAPPVTEDVSVRFERDGRVMVITIERPKQRNSLPAKVQWGMHRLFDYYEQNDDIWCAIITGGEAPGVPPAFCAGQDLKSVNSALGPTESAATSKLPPSGFGGVSFRNLTKPLIAACNGGAYGGGCEIVLNCDIVVASESAMFALPEVRSGVAALGNGLILLPRIVGRHRAMQMILMGAVIPAKEAMEWGIVNEVVPHKDVLKRALEIADSLQVGSPDAVRASKRAIINSSEIADWYLATDKTATEKEVIAFQGGKDAKEGPLSFAQKRKPNWSGYSKL
ncbi:hypothetical protein SmJEL517_g00664 [Synchytrium microbalum]|uniref:Enoyl-CoA hydratase n=1 Tax=Synchytrium microbalum TaxID=1806994 RepID=A0A507CHW8_9FUNG|nr:uncharacterized protein SmJEL517_g00664 [Synchytrium microbalum]TPX37726.1 hypothetical protein SmJEL517_g00664 [Synchytrium microbalum]